MTGYTRKQKRVRLTAIGASRFVAPAILTTVTSKSPSKLAEQPAGAEAVGATAEVTPWARATPMLLPTRARTVENCMVDDGNEWTVAFLVVENGVRKQSVR